MKGKSILTNKIESEIELLERHVKMLNAIMEHEPIGIIRLSELLDIPQHKVRYSLRILEQEGLINPSPEGAVTTEKLQSFFAEHLTQQRALSARIEGYPSAYGRDRECATDLIGDPRIRRQKSLINDQLCLANS